MVTLKIKTILCLGCLSFILNACGSVDPLLQPTDQAASVPPDDVEFTQYVSDSRANIEQILNELRPPSADRPYLGDYTTQKAAAMRSPFQVPVDDSTRCDTIAQGAGKGFLLIHGLTDSPYLMRSMSDSLSKEYPCALIRAVLLPGHGTVAGDSLKMDYHDWVRITDYGVNSFKQDKTISSLYLVGFSTGASLAINYMKENQVTDGKAREDKIKGLILLSTAVKAKSNLAFLTPIVRWFKDWKDVFAERDAARYESFSYNAGAQFYKLTEDLLDSDYVIDVPVLMAVSADDETINAQAAREFFCSPKVKQGALVWYQSIDPAVNTAINLQKTPELMCDNIVEIQLENIKPNFKTVNLSHTALSMSPEDLHYGVDGKYHHCKAYDNKKMVDEFNECQGDEKRSIFGENNVALLKDKLKLEYDYLRRGTFNPYYTHLEAKIFCFTDDECPVEDIMKTSRPD